MAYAKHLSAEEKEREKNKRKSLRKIILLIVIVVMASAVVAELVVLKSMTTVDRRFVRGVERGVADGWETGKGDLQLRDQGYFTDTSFIDIELDAVKDFRNKAYQDKDLKKLAKRYIDDLKKCSAASEAHDPAAEKEEFWEDFSVPYTDRLIVLRMLRNGDFKMGNGWDEYPEYRDEILSRAWALESISSAEFLKEETKAGISKFSANLKNDSGFDIEYLNLDIEIYDSKNNLSGIAEVFKENISKGSNTDLSFYFNDKKTAYYRIVAVDCRIVQPVYEE